MTSVRLRAYSIGSAFAQVQQRFHRINIEENGMAGKFELKTAKSGQFHFNLLAGNGQIIMQSEMYESKASALNGIASIQKNAADDARYDRLVSKSEKPYFVLKAGNHQVIGQSQMYESEAGRDNGIESVKKNAPEATTVDLTA